MTIQETAKSTNGLDMALEAATSTDVQALFERIQALEARVAELEEAPAQDIEDRLAMVVFSGELDRAIAAFIIATGAAAMGLEVSMFFTFWGLSVVKKERMYGDKKLLEKGFTLMQPGGSQGLGLSQMNFFGVGSRLIRKMMKDQDVASLEEMMGMAQEFGVRMVACDMTRELMGIREDELIDGMETGGVATFMGDAARAKASLFI